MQLNVKIYGIGVFIALALTACAASSTARYSALSGNTNDSPTTRLADARVQLGDGRVSFIAPGDLKPLTKDQIASSKFSKAKPPDHVFTNHNQYVAITFSFMPLAADQLSEYKETSVRFLSRLDPESQLLESEIVTINGTKWVHLEVANAQSDVDTHYHSYTTSLDRGALVFAFVSTVGDYPNVKDAFLKSAQTIQVKH